MSDARPDLDVELLVRVIDEWLAYPPGGEWGDHAARVRAQIPILRAGVAAGAARPPEPEPSDEQTARLIELSDRHRRDGGEVGELIALFEARIISMLHRKYENFLRPRRRTRPEFFAEDDSPEPVAASRPRPQEGWRLIEQAPLETPLLVWEPSHRIVASCQKTAKGLEFLGGGLCCYPDVQYYLPMPVPPDGAASPPPQEPALRITDKLCSCGTPLVWITAQQGAVCVVCLKEADDACVCERMAPPQEPDK